MPRQSKQAERQLPTRTLVVDNGAYSIKAGFATESPETDVCHAIPNCIAKDRARHIWIGAQLDKCTDFGELAFRRPVEKGFLVSWEVEKAIWDNSFLDSGSALQCDPGQTNLILTEAPNTPAALQSNCDQVIFEEYEFAAYSRCTGPSLNSFLDISHLFGAQARDITSQVEPAECLLVVDSGYSHTTVTPLLKGRVIQQAIRRLDIGGKFLTNHLKEIISIRHYNLNDETHLINQLKQDVCFVSDDFKRDLDITHKRGKHNISKPEKDIVIDYVLPDYNTNKSGHIRPHDPSLWAKMRKISSLTGNGEAAEDYMTLGNERFAVPELLFHPMDVGMKQNGIPEMIMSSLSGVPTAIWPAMLANTLIVGGNSMLPGFIERLESELRQLTPSECHLRVIRAPDPIQSAWYGGCELARNRSIMKTRQITRQEYQENGGSWLSRVFAGTIPR